MQKGHNKLHNFSAAGLLITLGIIYGDIGTSPIYAMRAVIGNAPIQRDVVLGATSCIFWTLMLITTFKYVWLALNNDNKGEGGIFALYALLRRYRVKWIILPTLIGCAALIADGFITPSISISSSVEGLRIIDPDINTVPIVIIILVALFVFQQFGTKVVGSVFGPVMTIWFIMIGTLGLLEILQFPSILQALNPMYAFYLLTQHPGGFWVLGAVFLCTAGAEALYSDLGHCGKKNVRAGWVFVFIMLMLNYLGQAAYLLQNEGTQLSKEITPFYALMPKWFLSFGIIIATSAAIIASQALITGGFTLINEAMKLKLWTNLRIVYPTNEKGQIYIPAVNWFLLAGCLGVIFLFRESDNMEAAYGLSIIFNMLMTTLLIAMLMFVRRVNIATIAVFLIIFLFVEGLFLVANVAKFSHGGWFTLTLASALFFALWLFYKGTRLRRQHINFIDIKEVTPMLKALMEDKAVEKEATNLVYMAMVEDETHLDSNIVYSIFRKKPKRADVYWFVHVNITSDPYGVSYEVDSLIEKKCFFVKLDFGFKVEHKVNLMFSKIVQEMVAAGEVDESSRYDSLRQFNIPADFKFIVLQSRIASDEKLTPWEMIVVKGYRFIKSLGISTAEDFGLEQSNLEEETVPINLGKLTDIKLERIEN